MVKSEPLTQAQIENISRLKSEGKTERQIAALFGLTQTRVHNALARQGDTEQQQKIAAIISSPVARETRKSVFDIIARLEECLGEIETLKEVEGRLADRVAVRTEKRMLIAEARATLESIYNVRLLDEFINEVTTILEEQTPGARQRIFGRLEASTKGFAAISLFAPGNSGGR